VNGVIVEKLDDEVVACRLKFETGGRKKKNNHSRPQIPAASL
jgi:hypothetical protein